MVVWHVDATGSVVRPIDDRPIYYYAVVMAMKKGLNSLPLYEFVTNVHNVGNLKMAFVAWWGHMAQVNFVPDIIVMDGSWAIIHATLYVFCMQTIDQHLLSLWNRLVEGSLLKPDVPCVRLCCSHFLKSVSRRLLKLPISKEVHILFPSSQTCLKICSLMFRYAMRSYILWGCCLTKMTLMG